MAEHLNLNQFPFRTANMLFDDVPMDSCDLADIEFSRQDDGISVLCVESQRLGVGYIQLGGEVHFDALLMCILQDGNIACDDSRYSRFFGVI